MRRVRMLSKGIVTKEEMKEESTKEIGEMSFDSPNC